MLYGWINLLIDCVQDGEGGAPAVGGGEEDTSEEAMLQRALAMSMDEGGAPDLAAMTEEEQIAYAMRMSMAEGQEDESQVRVNY